jgi:LytS/YehU family sensor histidine kinase
MYLREMKIGEEDYVAGRAYLGNNNARFTWDVIAYHADGVFTEYFLDGYSSEWKTSAQNELEIANLGPGNYTLRVRLKDHPQARELRVEFSILPRFWQTTAFRIALFFGTLLMLVFLIWLIARRYTRVHLRHQEKLQRENQLLELQRKSVDLEHMALRLQINPHFIFNALNSIHAEYTAGKLEHAEERIAFFARLLRRILELSKQRLIPLEEEIELSKAYLDFITLRRANKVVLTIENQTRNGLDAFLVPPMLFQPFIENSILHGFSRDSEEAQIVLRVLEKENCLRVSLLDNGKGQSEKKVTTQSMGIRITRERIELLCEEWGLASEMHVGNRLDGNAGFGIEFKLPKIEP